MIPDRARLGYGVGMSDDEARRNDLPVPEHFTEARLLVRSDDSRRLQINVQIGINSVIAEVVLLQHGVFQFVTPLLDILR